MKTLVYLLLVACPCLAVMPVSRDGAHGGSSHSSQPQQGSGQPLSSSYEGPPPPYDSQPSLYEPQPPQLSPSQFSYHSFQPNYLEPAWQPQQETGLLGTWLEKGLGVLGDLLPVAISVITVLAIFAFLGFIKVPLVTTISEARQHLGRALATVDVDQLANSVTLAINKYHEMFGGGDY